MLVLEQWVGWGGQIAGATLIMVKTRTNSDRVCITTKIDVQILMDHNRNRLQMFAESFIAETPNYI